MIVYLDMDGVLTDMDHAYDEFFNYTDVSRKNFYNNWTTFVKSGAFKTLPVHPEAKELLTGVRRFQRDYEFDIEILSSAGGGGLAKPDKLHWLAQKKIPYKANIVPGSKHKAKYAGPDRVLIDDMPYVLQPFIDAGGHGILHRTAKQTLSELSNILHKITDHRD